MLTSLSSDMFGLQLPRSARGATGIPTLKLCNMDDCVRTADVHAFHEVSALWLVADLLPTFQ